MTANASRPSGRLAWSYVVMEFFKLQAVITVLLAFGLLRTDGSALMVVFVAQVLLALFFGWLQPGLQASLAPAAEPDGRGQAPIHEMAEPRPGHYAVAGLVCGVTIWLVLYGAETYSRATTGKAWFAVSEPWVILAFLVFGALTMVALFLAHRRIWRQRQEQSKCALGEEFGN